MHFTLGKLRHSLINLTEGRQGESMCHTKVSAGPYSLTDCLQMIEFTSYYAHISSVCADGSAPKPKTLWTEEKKSLPVTKSNHSRNWRFLESSFWLISKLRHNLELFNHKCSLCLVWAVFIYSTSLKSDSA